MARGTRVAALLVAALLVAALALLALALPHDVDASCSTSFSAVCPKCSTGVLGKSEICTSITAGSTLAPGISKGYSGAFCMMCSNNTIYCDSERDLGRPTSSLNSFNAADKCKTQAELNVDSENCGSCGVKCTNYGNSSAAGPTCVAGQCQCQTGVGVTLCPSGKYCDGPSKTCTTCPTGTTTCSGTGVASGNVTDCVSLNSTVTSCGKCGNSCFSSSINGDRCSEGQCKCGTGPACGPRASCVNGACRRCDLSLSPSRTCVLNQFCKLFPDNTTDCAACPAGFGKAANARTGTEADCSVSVTGSGATPDCGFVGARANNHASQTCCAGVAKCGKFVNSSLPTDEECLAASVCGVNEFCDAVTGKCQATASLTDLNCKGNAFTPTGGNLGNLVDVTEEPFCGSCNTTLNWKDDECYLYDRSNCGSKGKICRDRQQCINGKCLCSTVLDYYLFKYEPWTSLVARPTLKQPVSIVQNNPLCQSLTTDVPLTWGKYMGTTVSSFAQCASLVGISNFTLTQFANAEFRATACPGRPFTCNATYCDAVYANVTKYRDDFCSATSAFVDLTTSCAKSIAYQWNVSLAPDTDNSCGSKPTSLQRCFSRIGVSISEPIVAATFLNCSFVNGGGSDARLLTSTVTLSTVAGACRTTYKDYPDAAVAVSAGKWIVGAVAAFVAVGLAW